MERVKKFNMLFFMTCFGRMIAGKPVSDSLSVVTDTSQIRQRSFPADLSEKYNDDAFDYTSVEGEAQNFLSRALQWLFRKLGELFGIELSPEMYQIIEIVIYMVLGMLVLYLVIRFLIGNTPNAFFTKKSSVLTPLTISEEHIENIDLDQYIKEALNQKNYRLAIRYMYLRTLKQLSWKELIDWHFDKTNTDYYHELKNEGIKANFKQVSYLYDYIWYGEFPLDETGFKSAEKDFDRLTKNIANAG